ncbi:GDIR1-like protein [Mya arenaria]|uniref:GDIR1-like protein n=1 Tax=Mya arenaria TaxID=6604 RepID=A0ABY7DJH6_MYAAR|nr:rho GDP-dissociation inhibitor 1-like [Mya arenaria]XP_052760612.1 rho GDP-dissociation inhibitor 1-like [Mya arenaria]WAQ96634.1 GDIR1-like protein [Mya arenaria]
MAESEEQQLEQVPEEETGPSVNYKPPAEKTIDEIAKTDAEDESLRKYKEQLLGNIEERVFWPNDPNKVILRKMSIVCDGRPDKEIDLGDKGQLKDMKFYVKEGAKYRIMITFNVQREIVAGLRFTNRISKGPFKNKEEYMVGSYGPKKEVHEYKSPEETFPGGLGLRGEYKVKSLFTDDDKNEILAWEWKLEIKKDWKD